MFIDPTIRPNIDSEDDIDAKNKNAGTIIKNNNKIKSIITAKTRKTSTPSWLKTKVEN